MTTVTPLYHTVIALSSIAADAVFPGFPATKTGLEAGPHETTLNCPRLRHTNDTDPFIWMKLDARAIASIDRWSSRPPKAFFEVVCRCV